MNEKAVRFFESIKGRRVCFIGAGVSHRQLIPLFAQKGAIVTLRDKRDRDGLAQWLPEFEAAGVELILGPDYLRDLCREEVIFRTPGMKFHLPELEEARRAGRVVTSEMEVFFDLCPCPIYGVTGSDGKTTTTTLIAESLKREGYTVHLGGNIGRPLLPEIEQVRPEDVAVVELSSFQLISMRRSPDVAVVTNVAPNHLDIHKDMQEYIDAKRNLLLHQNAFSRTVLNWDNDITREMSGDVRGALSYFSRRSTVDRGAWLGEDGWLCYTDESGTTRVLPKEEIRIPGLHNVENYLAAMAAVWGKVRPETIAALAREFGGVEHRIEFVRELDGVKWYNDSIATNPTRTMAGLDSFGQKLIILAGGYDKKIPYEPLAPKIVEKVKALILCGTTAPKIEAAVRACPGFDEAALPIYNVADLPAAVAKAREIAKAGDVVSLSPASASFDAYPNFEARGQHFKELVRDL